MLEESKPAASARPTSVRASSTSVRSLPMLAGARPAPDRALGLGAVADPACSRAVRRACQLHRSFIC